MNNLTPKYPLISIAMVSLLACCHVHATNNTLAPGQAPTLSQLLETRTSSTEDSASSSSIRLEALRTTALSIGTQAGLAFQYGENQKRLETISLYMSKTYPFQALMMEGNVVPPIIVEAVDVYDQQSSSQLRLADKERTILSPPRFSYAAPDWRDYFYHDFHYETTAIANVAPKTPEEEAIWKNSLAEGYKLGVEQANAVLDRDTARLARDLNGMRLYHQLLLAGKVTKPYVSVVHMGVTGNKNGTMKEGESLLQISATPEFIMNPGQWNVPLSESIQARLKVLADPIKGAELVTESGSSKEYLELPNFGSKKKDNTR